jgi:hypothetical protein
MIKSWYNFRTIRTAVKNPAIPEFIPSGELFTKITNVLIGPFQRGSDGFYVLGLENESEIPTWYRCKAYLVDEPGTLKTIAKKETYNTVSLMNDAAEEFKAKYESDLKKIKNLNAEIARQRQNMFDQKQKELDDAAAKKEKDSGEQLSMFPDNAFQRKWKQ